jgi:peptide chain release factor 2
MSEDKIPSNDEELLQNCIVETFRSSGKGGQHANKTESAVRITHIPTQISTICQDERSQLLNKKKCIIQLREKLIKFYETPKKRIPTKKPYKAKEKVLDTKKKQSVKKQLRKKIGFDNINEE